MTEFRKWLLASIDKLDCAFENDRPGEWSGYLAGSIAADAGNTAARLGLAELHKASREFKAWSDVPAAKTFLAACLASIPAHRPDYAARFLAVEDAGAYVGVSVESIRRMLATGKLTALRPVKGRIVVDRLQLDAVVLSSDARPRKGRGLKR